VCADDRVGRPHAAAARLPGPPPRGDAARQAGAAAAAGAAGALAARGQRECAGARALARGARGAGGARPRRGAAERRRRRGQRRRRPRAQHVRRAAGVGVGGARLGRQGQGDAQVCVRFNCWTLCVHSLCGMFFFLLDHFLFFLN